MGFFYRVRQYWFAMMAVPSVDDLDRATEVLSPDMLDLFLRMQPVEQVHSLKIFKHLSDSGERSPELLAAALLHDVGKSRYPLRAWERALAVLGRALFPRWAEGWGRFEPRGWNRPFVVAAQHPVWGAELVEKAGGHPITVSLIRRHQDLPKNGNSSNGHALQGQSSPEDGFLARLQKFDNES